MDLRDADRLDAGFRGIFRFERHLVGGRRAPLVVSRLFNDSDFLLGIGLTVGFYMISAFLLSFPEYLRGVLGASNWQAGLANAPPTVRFLLGSLGSPRMLQRWGHGY